MKKQRFPVRCTKQGTTVTIYRNKHPKTKSGWIYQVSYHAGGKRFLKQFTDYKKAENEALLKAAQLSAGQMDAAQMKKQDRDELMLARELAGGISLIEVVREWKRVNELTNGNSVEAGKLWKATHATDFERTTLEDAVSLFKAAKARQGVDVAKAYKNRLEQLQDVFPGAYLNTITTRQLNTYLNRIDHPVSRNTHRKNLVTMWNWCRKQGLLPDTVRTAAENTDRAQEADGSKVEIYDIDGAKKVLRFISKKHPEYIAPVALGFFCGLRCGETHKQVWDDIDLTAGTLHVTSAKPRTPADRIVEIPQAGIEWLMKCGNRTGAVCNNLAMDRIKFLCRKAKLPTPRNGARHSFITYAMAAGKTAGQVASIAGTSEVQIHKHYRRPRPRAEGEKWFGLTPDEVLKEDEGKVINLRKAK